MLSDSEKFPNPSPMHDILGGSILVIGRIKVFLPAKCFKVSSVTLVRPNRPPTRAINVTKL